LSQAADTFTPRHFCQVLCTMATGIPVISSESDVFTVLKRYDIVFADHVEFILRSLGYRCLRSITSISDITAIEGYVKDIIYS
jgi:hypothetical protein